MNQDDLQEKIDGGDSSDNSPDADAFRIVFSALKKQSFYELPAGFSRRIVAKIEHAKATNETTSDRVWMAGGILCLVLGFAYAITTIDFTPTVGIYAFLSAYSGPVLFGIIFIVVVHLLDKFVLRVGSSRN